MLIKRLCRFDMVMWNIETIVFAGILTIFTVLNSSASPTSAQEPTENLEQEFSVDPLNAAYSIEGRTVRLKDGRSEIRITPHSASTIKTVVYGKPVYGDLDGDGRKDAAILLIHDPGGSGTFFYVAGALNINGTIRGTNAVWLGDRITPPALQIHDGILIVRYADRGHGEPMVTTPTVQMAKYLILKNAQLESIVPIEEDEQMVEGWVTIGHEVRSFRPCPEKKEHWLQGDSPALSRILVAYGEAMPDPKLYLPLFMILAGKTTIPPAEGFGAEYEAAFLATQLVRVTPGGTCSMYGHAIDSSGIREDLGFTTRGQEKLSFDITILDPNGLYGESDGKRALTYEFCIPGRERYKSTVKQIDATLQCMSESPGRIGCDSHELLCIGSTHQPRFREVLRGLTELPYITRIDQSFFE